MLDFIGLRTSDLAVSRPFYDKALAAIGMKMLFEAPPRPPGNQPAFGYGEGPMPYFWIGQHIESTAGLHVAFKAVSRAQVDAFHTAGVEAGGRDHGSPSLKPHIFPNYYSASVMDPDGHHLEAVCYAAE